MFPSVAATQTPCRAAGAAAAAGWRAYFASLVRRNPGNTHSWGARERRPRACDPSSRGSGTRAAGGPPGIEPGRIGGEQAQVAIHCRDGVRPVAADIERQAQERITNDAPVHGGQRSEAGGVGSRGLEGVIQEWSEYRFAPAHADRRQPRPGVLAQDGSKQQRDTAGHGEDDDPRELDERESGMGSEL